MKCFNLFKRNIIIYNLEKMKIQIRKNVFETNSSSTHSLQITQQTIEQARENVEEMIRKSYGEQYPISDMDISEFLKPNYDKGNTYRFYLEGFELKDSDESHNVYYIIKDWVYKLQYLVMIFNNYAWYFEDYNTDKEWLKLSRSEFQEKLLDNKECKYLCNKVKEIGIINGYNIKEVIPNFDICTYLEEIKPKELFDLDKGGKITYEEWKNFVNIVMDDSYIITYADEAYQPYSVPDIKIY